MTQQPYLGLGCLVEVSEITLNQARRHTRTDRFQRSHSIKHASTHRHQTCFKDHTQSSTQAHTCTDRQEDSCERVTSSSHRPLPARHTTNTRDEHPCPHLDSNPRSRQLSGFRCMPNAAQPPLSASVCTFLTYFKYINLS